MTISPLPGGLINQTFLLSEGQRRLVLQRVNPVFPASIHGNIHTVTTTLADHGLTTPLLIPTNEGQLCLELTGERDKDDGGGVPGGEAEDQDPGATVWRIMTHVEGVSFDVVAGAAQARAAGELVARFHTALDGLTAQPLGQFTGMRVGVHDTPRHLERLRHSVLTHQDHRLFAQVSLLGDQILGDAAELQPLPGLGPRICHGDLKFNNLLFAGAVGPPSERAVCLVDLDTVGPMALAFEMGDAWRSWCNRSGEDRPDAQLDLDVFEASLDGYCQGLGRGLGADERRALLLGPEWISLELASRFAADALLESYFGWDPTHFPGRGEHNLIRAQGQHSLYRALLSCRPRRARLLGVP